MPSRTDPWPYERLIVSMALGMAQRGAEIPQNVATACAITANRLMRDMTADPCEHVCASGDPTTGLMRCDECGEWTERVR